MSSTETAVRLEQARTALHQLMTGQQMVSLTDPTGRRVEFSRANRADLEEYIRSLEAAQLGARRGPLGVTW